MPKLTLDDVETARANTPVDYYRKDAETLDVKAYRDFVQGQYFKPGIVIIDDTIAIQSTEYARRGKKKRRYQVHIFLNDKRDRKLDQLCFYIPVWAYFKTEAFRVQSGDETNVETSDTFSIHAIQGSKHVRIASSWLVKKNDCTISTEWFTAKFTYDPYTQAAGIEYKNKGEKKGEHLMSKERRRLGKGQKMVKGHITFTPDLKAALEKAAKAENSSASRIIHEVLEKTPRVAQYLDLDTHDS